jgi:chromosome partitioning protein
VNKLRLPQLSDLTKIKRHTLNARLKAMFTQDELERTSSNQILLSPEQSRKIISGEVCINKGKVIYVGNLKGGVGKTTISYLLSSALSSLGLKVCVIDLDVQANLTNQYNASHPENCVFYDLIDSKKKIEDIIIPINETLDIIPSSLRNSLIEKALSMQTPKHHITWFNKLCLKYLRNKYDVIIVDTPPHLTTLNSVFTLCLKESDSVIVPVCPEEFSILGVQMFIDDMKEIRQSYEINDDPQTLILMNKFFQNQKTNLEVLIKMGNLYDGMFSESIIKDSAKMREVMNNKIPVGQIKKGRDIHDTISDLLQNLNIIQQA